MKKFKVTFLALIIFSVSSFAQDIITTKKGEVIPAKVVEVNTTVIKYKKHTNLNGPTYTLLIADVTKINYENGEVTSYTLDTITTNSGEDIPSKVIEIGLSEVKYKKLNNLDGPVHSILKSEILIIRFANGTKEIFNEPEIIEEKVVEVDEVKNEEPAMDVQPNEPKVNAPPVIPQDSKTIDKSISKLKVGLIGGFHMSDWSQDYVDPDDEIPTFFKGSFNAGINVEASLNKSTSLRTGLYYYGKGARLNTDEYYADDETYTDGYGKYILRYLEVPAHLVLKSGSGFQVYAGPYFAFGIGGKITSEINGTFEGETYSEIEETTLVPWFGEIEEGDISSSDEAFNGFDIGVDVGFGLYSKTTDSMLSFGYSHGLGNTLPNYKAHPQKDVISNRLFKVTMTFYLSKIE